MTYCQRLKRLEQTGSMLAAVLAAEPGVERRHEKFYAFWAAQDGKCAYCDAPMTLQGGLPRSATWDHVVPRSRGGTKAVDNVVLACYSCNQAKGTLSADKFRFERNVVSKGPRTMSDPAKLGDEVKDIVTSFKGVMVARTKWLHGCDRISVEPATLTDGQPQKVQHFDEQRIEVVTPGLIPWKNLGAEGTIPLGAKVRDTVTGFSGIAVSYSQWLGGSNTYSVEPDKLNDKGQPGESCGFDVGRVVLVEEKSVPVSRNAVNTLPGGLPRGEQAAMRRGDR